MKDVLMIHELSQEMFELPLEDYILTFDDGLYTQYKYLEQLKVLNTPKIFFVSSNLVRPLEMAPSDEFIACGKAHKKAFDGSLENNLENYMSWEEILEIHNTENCEIGGHGHDHLKLWDIKSTRDRYNAIATDTKAMVKTFKTKGIKLESFCFPYNYEDPLLSGVIKRNGINNIFGINTPYLGKQRTAIEKIGKY